VPKDVFRERVVSLVRDYYAHFGPTLAREYLSERRHQDRLPDAATVDDGGGLVEGSGCTPPRPRPNQLRYRRDCRGEPVQIDGSKRWWLEDRVPRCTLLVYIDDATSDWMHLEMVESERTFSYMRATQAYIERHCKPVAFYSDKHSVFRNNCASANGDGMSPVPEQLKRESLARTVDGVERAIAFLGVPRLMAAMQA
jgi:hypothetical protein